MGFFGGGGCQLADGHLGIDRSCLQLILQEVGAGAAYRVVFAWVDGGVALGENPLVFGQQGAHA